MSIDNFTGKVADYDKGRPGYPKGALDFVISLTEKDAVFADIGAGTGKLTRELLKRGCTVFAAEPNGDMRRQLIQLMEPYQKIKILGGTAEATGLPDHSVNAVTVAHALHWFDPDAFRSECRRILKPAGWVIALYNLTPGGGMQSLSKKTADAFFQNPEIFSCPNPMDYTRESWLCYIASQDDSPLPGSQEYAAHIESVNAGFDRDSQNGLLRCDRVTRIYAERIESWRL